jgi:hypothetical protein
VGERETRRREDRFWAMWQLDKGDYQAIREELFAGETVQTLYEKVRVYQEAESETDEGRRTADDGRWTEDD